MNAVGKSLQDVFEEYPNADAFILEVENQLKRLASENPDYVYNPDPLDGCSYISAPDGCESSDGCIFGQAFQRMGVDKSHLNLDMTISLMMKNVLDIEDPPKWYSVQMHQDNGGTWGEAIKALDTPAKKV